MNRDEIETKIIEAERSLAALTGNALANVQVAACIGSMPPRAEVEAWLKEFGLTLLGEARVTAHRDPRPLLLVSAASGRPLPEPWVLVELTTLEGTTTRWAHRELNLRYKQWMDERDAWDKTTTAAA